VINSGNNSGYQAINLAYHMGAKNIFLVGFDMKNGGKHWHGCHPDDWGNSEDASGWAKNFDKLAEDLDFMGVNVVNCTVDTALTCFKQDTIEGAFNAL